MIVGFTKRKENSTWTKLQDEILNSQEKNIQKVNHLYETDDTFAV